MSRILAVDPGYDRVGVAVLERQNGVDTLLFSTCVITNRKDSLGHRLTAIGDALTEIIRTHSPTHLAIETLFFNRNITTGIGVAQARGVIIYTALAAGCSLLEYGPQEVKVAVTGYGKSDKQGVYTMVQRLIKNAPEKALDDEYDAIAVGITALAHQR